MLINAAHYLNERYPDFYKINEIHNPKEIIDDIIVHFLEVGELINSTPSNDLGAGLMRRKY